MTSSQSLIFWTALSARTRPEYCSICGTHSRRDSLKVSVAISQALASIAARASSRRNGSSLDRSCTKLSRSWGEFHRFQCRASVNVTTHTLFIPVALGTVRWSNSLSSLSYPKFQCYASGLCFQEPHRRAPTSRTFGCETTLEVAILAVRLGDKLHN
jgi:hypothetical protein